MITQGVVALDQTAAVLKAVSEISNFTAENDPYASMTSAASSLLVRDCFRNLITTTLTCRWPRLIPQTTPER
jgi:hypothetical protein